MKRMLTNRKGFSLIELLIAISLLAIGLLAAAAMQGVAINSNGIANTVTVATAIGEEVLEKLMARRSTDPVLNTNAADVVFDLDPNTAATTLTIRGAGTFDARYTITTGTPIPNITTIVVTVAVEGTSRTVQVSGYKRT